MTCNCSLTHRQIHQNVLFLTWVHTDLRGYWHSTSSNTPIAEALGRFHSWKNKKILKGCTFTWRSWKVYDDIHSPFWLQVNLQSRKELEKTLEWFPKQVTAHAGNKIFQNLWQLRCRQNTWAGLQFTTNRAKRCWGPCTSTEVKKKCVPLALGKLEPSEFYKSKYLKHCSAIHLHHYFQGDKEES